MVVFKRTKVGVKDWLHFEHPLEVCPLKALSKEQGYSEREEQEDKNSNGC